MTDAAELRTDTHTHTRPPARAIARPSNVATIIVAWDGQKVGAELKHLLDQKGYATDLIVGMSVAALDYAQTGGVLIAIWTQDGALDVAMYGPAEAACSRDNLIELRIGPYAPPIQGRKVSPIDFTDWRGQRNGPWLKLLDRLRAVDRRDPIPDEAKIAAVVMTAMGGMIAIPAAFDRVIDPAIGVGAGPSAVVQLEEVTPPQIATLALDEPMMHVGGLSDPPVELVEDFTPSRVYRASSMRYRAPPAIPALQSAEAIVAVDIRRRGLVSRILAAANDLPLIESEQSQSN